MRTGQNRLKRPAHSTTGFCEYADDPSGSIKAWR